MSEAPTLDAGFGKVRIQVGAAAAAPGWAQVATRRVPVFASDDAVNGRGKTVAVRALALVEAEWLIVSVAAKMVGLHADIGAVDRALEQRPKVQ